MNSAPVRNTEFSFLDQVEFRSRYAFGPAQDKMCFYVSGVRCGKCVRKIEDLSLKLPGLTEVRVEMGENLAHVQIEPGTLSFGSLAAEISALGYTPIPVSPDAGGVLARKKDDRREVIRLGVAAACAGNIMTFSFANYLGAPDEFRSMFTLLSFLIYLPVVTYVAWPFYLGAWSSLKTRQVSIDLPMAIASLAGFIFSTIQLVRGFDDIYYDSLSGFLFLILLSRWAQKRIQRRFLNADELTENLRLERARRVSDAGWTWTPSDRLIPGDLILAEDGETLPADCELASQKGHFNLAWLSGELGAKTFLRGAIVPAGARLAGGSVELRVIRPLPETAFGKLLDSVKKFALSRTHIISLADRWAQWLLGIVLGIGVLFMIAYWHVSPEEAIRRFLALIVLACPCAMAFGTPLALAAALRESRKRGLVIRNADVFEKAQGIKTIFFDKTGTLTETDLVLTQNGDALPQVYQKVILSLENDSVHPIAFAFRKAFAAPEVLPPVDNWRETPGKGVSGYVYGRFYELMRTPGSTSTINCTLFEDQAPVHSFSFAAALKPDCANVLDELRHQGYLVKLISGDAKESALDLGKKLGFAESDIYFEVSPDQKAEIVASAERPMMIGDGVNDSLALMKAEVGVAASGGMEAALRSSDAYLSSASLNGILTLFKVSRESFGLIRRNLLISIIYNSIGGVMALLGLINPFVAALLMPVSSGFILLSSWFYGGRE